MNDHAVLFDLGNTLVEYYELADFPPILEGCLRHACDEWALSLSPTAFHAVYERAKQLNRERTDHVVQPLAERLEVLLGKPLPASRRDAVCAAFLRPILARAKLNPAAVPLLRALRGRGAYVGLVSNTPWGSPAEPWRAELERHGLSVWLDACVFCVDVGFRKPHIAPFRRALELLDVTAEQTVFVGDDPAWDVTGARAAGLTPLLLDPRGRSARGSCAAIAHLDEVLTFLDRRRNGRGERQGDHP